MLFYRYTIIFIIYIHTYISYGFSPFTNLDELSSKHDPDPDPEDPEDISPKNTCINQDLGLTVIKIRIQIPLRPSL